MYMQLCLYDEMQNILRNEQVLIHRSDRCEMARAEVHLGISIYALGAGASRTAAVTAAGGTSDSGDQLGGVSVGRLSAVAEGSHSVGVKKNLR